MREFRIEVEPQLLGTPNASLRVRVAQCPVPGLREGYDVFQVRMSREELIQLRQKPPPHDMNLLRTVGQRVRESFFGTNVWAAFNASRHTYEREMMRIVICVDTPALREPGPNEVRPDEIPVELLWDSKNDFYSLDRMTPVVRGLSSEPDREPEAVPIPLRVLVVVASPMDKPRSSIEQEVEVIKTALGRNLANEKTGLGGPIWVKWCAPGTKDSFRAMLTEFNPHIFHFVGHGGFDPVQEGYTAQGYICFENPDDRFNSDAMTADEMATLLRNSSTRLAVLTACSSAQPAPLDPEKSYNTFAFEGVAQKLVSGVSGVTAAIAMQFDIEPCAAIEFSRVFYDNLVKPGGVTLEEAITQARLAIQTKLSKAHPAWIAPVLFTRSKNGFVFNLQYLTGSMTDEQKKELYANERELRVYRDVADRCRNSWGTNPPAWIASELAYYVAQIQKLESERSQILGDSVRIRGLRAVRGAEVELPIHLRVRCHSEVDRIQFDVSYPPHDLNYRHIAPGSDSVTSPAISNEKAGVSTVLINWPGGSPCKFAPGEHEIAKLSFNIPLSAEPGFKELTVTNVGMYHGANLLATNGLSAVILID